jgi:N-acetylglucosaminyl-diphospho-decaprenol L-rhamnosyltransferase
MGEGINLSVVIVNWNVRALLEKCLRSLLHAPGWQLVSPGSEHSGAGRRALEVWVVDSASADGSAEMVRGQFPDVGLITNSENVGFTRGNNQGIARCRGRALLLLNPDTEVPGDALGVMVDYLDAHPDVGVVGPRIVTPEGGIQPSRRRFPTYGTAFVESTCLQQWFPRHPLLARYYMWNSPDDQEQELDWLEGACLLARAETVRQVGGLDEQFFMYSEELDWCQRIKGAGWRVVYLPQAQIIHYGGKSSDQVVAAKHVHFQRSKIAYYSKYFGGFRGGLLRWFLLATYAWMSVVEGLKWLVGHRRPLRSERIAAYREVLRSGLR